MKVVVELQILDSGRARDVHASTVGPKFERLILKRIAEHVDSKLIPEHAGFRSGNHVQASY